MESRFCHNTSNTTIFRPSSGSSTCTTSTSPRERALQTKFLSTPFSWWASETYLLKSKEKVTRVTHLNRKRGLKTQKKLNLTQIEGHRSKTKRWTPQLTTSLSAESKVSAWTRSQRRRILKRIWGRTYFPVRLKLFKIIGRHPRNRIALWNSPGR